jgi:farnesyl-diphosphate farnesyltransferase
LTPADLLDARQESRFRPLYNRHLEQAKTFLLAGWEYTNALPFSQVRVRLACALPILIGIKTLVKLQNNPILQHELRIKITRDELRGIAGRVLIWYPWPKKWRRMPDGRFFQA